MASTTHTSPFTNHPPTNITHLTIKMGDSKTPPSPKGVLGKSQQWPAPPPPMH
jgi:hypothetical protein